MIYKVNLGPECEKDYCKERVDSMRRIITRDRNSWGKPCLLSIQKEEVYWKDILDCKTRNMVRKSEKANIKCVPIDKNAWLNEVYEINKSSLFRQGRMMSDGYRKFPKHTDYRKECDKHYWVFMGAFLKGKLIAYTSLLPCKDILLVSQILGCPEYFYTGVMNLILFSSVVHMAKTNKYIKVAQYDFWNSGSNGLRHFKKSLGFIPDEIQEQKEGE